jgi:hypothetical protein
MKNINSVTLAYDPAGNPTVRIEAEGVAGSKVCTFRVDDDLMEEVARLCVQRECFIIPWEDIIEAASKSETKN